MNIIHKQVISSGYDGLVKIQVPEGSTPLKIANQYDKLVVWYSFDTMELAVEEWTFSVILTGESYYENTVGEYFDTVSFNNGQYVVHVFLDRPF